MAAPGAIENLKNAMKAMEEKLKAVEEENVTVKNENATLKKENAALAESDAKHLNAMQQLTTISKTLQDALEMETAAS